MENKIKEFALKIRNSDKKLKALIALGIIGMLLILLSETTLFSTNKKEINEYSYDDYICALEDETRNIIEAIDGAGECRVMLTLKSSKSSEFAKNIQENHSESSYSDSYEYVFYKGASGEEPVLIKEYFPQVLGVAVVCSGGNNTAVKEEIINCLSSVFDIPSSKISVSKLKE